MNGDNANDVTLLANISAQAKSVLGRVKLTAKGITLYVNSDEIEFMTFKQGGAISSLNRKP